MINLVRSFATERLGHRYIAVGRTLYQVRRVSSADLLRDGGYAALEGRSAVDGIRATWEEKLKGIRAGLNDPRIPEAQKVQIRRELKERSAEAAAEQMRAMLDTPDQQATFTERCQAYTCAMVTGIGQLLELSSEPRVLPTGADLSEFAEDLRTDDERSADVAPVYIDAMQFVRRELDQDVDSKRLWVAALDQRELAQLFYLLKAIQEVPQAIPAAFRAQSGDADGAGQDGEAMGAAPIADPQEPARGHGGGPDGARARPGASETAEAPQGDAAGGGLGERLVTEEA